MPRYRIRYDRRADDDIKALTLASFPDAQRLAQALALVEQTLIATPEAQGWEVAKARRGSPAIRIIFE